MDTAQENRVALVFPRRYTVAESGASSSSDSKPEFDGQDVLPSRGLAAFAEDEVQPDEFDEVFPNDDNAMVTIFEREVAKPERALQRAQSVRLPHGRP